ncbi:MAG: hypothetical protein PHY45_12675 [Rhodocyclaceae bacterium]|nr:hypothetical protein [Rhodocyclaceae bacterium]
MATPVFDSGAVRLSLRWRDGRMRDVAVRVARPNAAAMLRGRAADEAVRMLPLLYSICGAAQGVAAQLALGAARGVAQAPIVDAVVLAEAQREHLWRLLLDWPQALGLPRQESLLVAGRRHLQDGSFDAWASAAMRAPWAQIEAALRAVPEPPSPGDAPLLPALAAAQTLALWPRLDAAFAAAPAYYGRAASTGALARHPELLSLAPLLARVAARMADLTAPHGLGRVSAAAVAPGIGRAAVETARGLLLHEIVLDGERVADYVIVAPTEWNFHPAGMLKAWLEGAPAAHAEEMRAAAARAMLALDPCVRWEIDTGGSEPA